MKLFPREKSVHMSLPKKANIHGIPIRKATIGTYLASMQDIQQLPELIMQKCYPNMGIMELISQAKMADHAFLLDLLGRVAVQAPDIILDLAVQFICPDRDKLLQLTPNEFLDVLLGWWKMNDLSDFFKRVWTLVKLETIQTIPGSSTGSPSLNRSV